MDSRVMLQKLGAGSQAVLRGLGTAARAMFHATRRQARIPAKQVAIRCLESRQLDKFAEMGKIVYEMYAQDRVRTQRLRVLCEQVKKWEDEIAALKEQIAQLQESEVDNDGARRVTGSAREGAAANTRGQGTGQQEEASTSP